MKYGRYVKVKPLSAVGPTLTFSMANDKCMEPNLSVKNNLIKGNNSQSNLKYRLNPLDKDIDLSLISHKRCEMLMNIILNDHEKD